MTKNCIKQVLALQEESEVFADLSIEQLLYSCVAACGLDETFSVLQSTDWKKYCPGESYHGMNKYSRIIGITVENKKTVREIDLTDLDYDLKVNMVLRYL